jgi:hypothetical protein
MLQELINFDQREKFWFMLLEYYSEMKLFALAHQYHLILTTRTKIREHYKNKNMVQFRIAHEI